MAVPKQSKRIDPAALARQFADQVSAIPEVKRVWYWSKMGHHAPGVLSLDLFVLLSTSDARVEQSVTDAMSRLHESWPNMMLAVMTFTEEQTAEFGVDDELRDGSVEIPLSGVRR